MRALDTQRRCAAAAAQCGPGFRIGGDVEITGYDKLVIGENVHIGDGSFIRAEGGLYIGSHSHISRRVVIYTMNHNYNGSRLPYDETSVFRPVRIGHSVWIGIGATILPGASIGDGAIIGAGATVGGIVEALSIVGAPRHVPIAQRDGQHFESLTAAGQFGGRGGRPLNDGA